MNQERSAWLERAMEQWETSLLRMCYAYLGEVSLAEDAVQDTFLKAWKSYERFRGEASEKTWLMRIAMNTCKDIRRSAWFLRVDLSVSTETLPEASAFFTPHDDAVTCAVMNLKPRFREVVLLHWYQGLSVKETAAALRISRSTAFRRLGQARSMLQKGLEDWYHEA